MATSRSNVQRPAPRPQPRQPSRPGNQRPGADYESGWGARLAAFLLLGLFAGLALFILDEESDTLEAGYILAGVGLLVYAGFFVQQMRARYALVPDRLEAWGLRGLSWSVALEHIEGIRYDPTQGGFPFGKAIVLYDRQKRMLAIPRSVTNVKDLAARLIEAHTRTALPEMLVRLEAGDDLHFGESIAVNRDMIIAPDPSTRHPTQYGLRDFQQAYLRAHELTLNLIGNKIPLKLKVSDVLNAHLLVTIITKAKSLGPRVEIELPVDHDTLERTESMDKLVVTGENKPLELESEES